MLNITGVQGHLDHELLEQGQLHARGGDARLLFIKCPRDRWRVARLALPIEKKRALQPVVGNEDLHRILSDEEDVAVFVADSALEEDVRVEVDRGAPSILRHPMAVVDVLGDLLRRLFVDQIGVGGVGVNRDGEQAMDNDVSITADRRREVSVDGASQAIMPES